MTKLAIIQKCPSNTKWDKHFPLAESIDIFNLCPERKEKILVRDMDPEIRFGDYSSYDAVILIGSEALKQFSKVTSITTFSGQKVPSKVESDNFYALMSPGMAAIKPEAKVELERCLGMLNDVIFGGGVTKYECEVRKINTEKEALEYLTEVLNDPEQEVGLDSETTGFNYLMNHILGISITKNLRSCAYIDSSALSEECLLVLQKIIDTKERTVFHNAKFDLKFFMHQLGLVFRGNYNVEDTMLEHYVLDEREGTHGLKDLAVKYTPLGNYDLELELFKKDYCATHGIKQEEFTYDLIPFDILAEYGALDSLATLMLHKKFKPLINNSANLCKLYNNTLKRAMRFLTRMEMNGIPVSVARLTKAQEILTSSIYADESELYSMKELREFEADKGGVLNVNSPKQVREFLFDYLKLPVPDKRTDTGNISVDKEVLENLAPLHPCVNLMHNIKKRKKLDKTYISKLLSVVNPDERVRTNFNLHTTTSGRLSSSGDFNAQQLPRDDAMVKGCVKARDGYKIVAVDLETAEVYYAAALSGDAQLQDVFIRMRKNPEQYSDFHSTIAHLVFRLECSPKEVKKLFPHLRQAAKAISFGILYGSGPSKVADTVNLALIEAGLSPNCTKEDAEGYIRDYFARFPQLERWIKKCHDQIKTDGFIYNYYGRKRRLRNINSPDRSIASAELRSGFNAVIQSVSSDCLLTGVMDAEEEIHAKDLDVQIFALVHDSCVAEVRDDLVDTYLEILQRNIQNTLPRIEGCPIGVGLDGIHQDYACGKLEYQYPEIAEC